MIRSLRFTLQVIRRKTTFKGDSAPWVRGTHMRPLRLTLSSRFSPVGTGNTRIALNDIVDEAVQPRGYGEHVAFISSTNVQGGSAPWVRGTHRTSYH